MIKANIKSYSKYGPEEKLGYEHELIFRSVADMERHCKDRSTQYHRIVGEVLQEWDDNDPEAQQAYFTQLVGHHDITFQYSDDHSVWRKGQQERDVITHYANVIGKDVATKIWNDNIDASFSDEAARKQFYWKV
jgi:hypothetical protein